MRKLSLSLEPIKLPLTIEPHEAKEIFTYLVLPADQFLANKLMWHMVYLGIDEDRIIAFFKPYIDADIWTKDEYAQKHLSYVFKKRSLEEDLEKKKLHEAKKFLLDDRRSGLTFSEDTEISDIDPSFLKFGIKEIQNTFETLAREEYKLHSNRKNSESTKKFTPTKQKTAPKLPSKKAAISRRLAATPERNDPQAIRNHQILSSWATRIDNESQNLKPRPWLIDGLIGEGGLSVIYGEPAAGKTFLANDMAYCVSQGLDWFGRKVNQGLVLYIAAERPQITKRRLIFYKSHYKPASLPIYVYENPFDLFNSGKDVDDLVAFVNEAQIKEASTFKLLIFDTLAKVMVGANENLTADMGKVIAALDRITANTLAHCMVIHHSGKDQTKGARGSNSLLGAIDTEIAVIKNKASRYLEVKKQREGEEGLKLGFELKAMTIQDSSGETNTSCIVAPATLTKSTDLPPRVNKVEKAITSELEGTEGLCKTPLVKSIAERLGFKNLNQVYKKLALMVASGQVVEFDKEGALWVTINQTSSVVP